MKKPTDRQKAALKRLVKSEDGREPLSPDLARQLIRKGLAHRCAVRPTYQRVEWNRVVATLWIVKVTDAGREAAAQS